MVPGAGVRADGLLEGADSGERIGKIDGLAIAQSIDNEIGLLGIPGAYGNRPCEISQGGTTQSEKAAQQPRDDRQRRITPRSVIGTHSSVIEERCQSHARGTMRRT